MIINITKINPTTATQKDPKTETTNKNHMSRGIISATMLIPPEDYLASFL
jgi:hypothetical protein